MKRRMVNALVILLLLSGCAPPIEQPGSEKDLQIVCTIFPIYDWTREVLGGDSANLTLLLDNGTDMHNYLPSVDDIVTISACDLFIYVGGESDKWVDGALTGALNGDMTVINLLDTLGSSAKEETLVEGMEGGEEEDGAYDEHVWLSLRNAELFCSVIADTISTLDQDNSEVYQSNLEAYTEKLAGLDMRYKRATDAVPNRTLLFADRFPFLYLLDDYGLDYYAAFPGCSAETEAGFETIMFLAEKADQLDLNAIMVTESSNQSIAKTILNNSKNKDRSILVMDSMQSLTAADVRNGITYLSIMEDNLDVLTKALTFDN